MIEDLAASRKRVAEVARNALARGFDGKPQEVPEHLVTAVVDGHGDREAVIRATRQAFGDQAPLELVVFDTDRIGSFVFESSRPPVIAGASQILRGLNEGIGRRYPSQVIFSGGGEGILLVAAGEGDAICDAIEQKYAEATEGALGVTTQCLPFAPAELLGEGRDEEEAREGSLLVSGTPAVLARIRDRIRRKKEERAPGLAAVRGGEQRCLSCRDRAGRVDASSLRQELPGKLCLPCVKRWRAGKALIAGVSLEEMIRAFSPAGSDESRSKQSYVGFLYADGNAMGALFGRLRSLAELRFLSVAVAHIFEQVRGHVEGQLREMAPEGLAEPPGLSFLGGGDEAIWILPAKVAVAVAEKLAGWVEAESENIPDLDGILLRAGCRKLTIGTGLVLCEHKYPVRYQFELAKLLQKNAKKLFYEAPREQAVSSLDFEVLTDASPASDDLETVRRIVYGSEDPKFWRICRPYEAEALKQLLGHVRAAARLGIGKAQLYALQTGAVEGKKLFLNYLLYQIARNRKRYGPWLEAMKVDLERQSSLQSFFIHPLATGDEATWIPDALQLAPFLDSTAGAGD